MTRSLLLVAIVFSIMNMIGCSTSATESNVRAIVTSVEILPNVKHLTMGQTQQFTAIAKNRAGDIVRNVAFIWSSTDPSVVRVSDVGLVSVLAVGTAEIIASAPNGILGTTNLILQPSVLVPDNIYCPKTGVWAGGGTDGPALLPQDCFNTASENTPSPGAVIRVQSSGDLNAILSNAQCGETLVLEHGYAWEGPIVFPAKHCDDQHWITITTDGNLPPEGTRLKAANSAELAQVTLRPGSQANTFGDHLRFVGIEWSKEAGAAVDVLLDTNGASKVIFDRNYCHGNPGEETRRCLMLGSGASYIAVIDSYVAEFHCIAITGTCSDAQAISGGTGVTTTVHGIKVVNNLLEASGENILFGGGAANGCGPTDVEVRRNHFYKPMSWNPADPSYEGIPYIVKNLFELKNGCRILLEGNVLENTWGGYSQEGYAIALGPKNQAGANDTNLCPVCSVRDVTIRYNVIRHAGGTLEVVNTRGDNGGWALAGERYSIHDVVADGLQYSTCFECGRNLNELSSGYSTIDPPPPGEILSDVSLRHITEIANSFLAQPMQESAAFVLSGPPIENPSATPQVSNITVTDSIIATGKDGTYPTGGGMNNNCSVIKGLTTPVNEIAACWSGSSSFLGNVLVGDSLLASDWPGKNYLSLDWADVGFVNYNNGEGGDYHLAPSSPFRGMATDGIDPGADIDIVLERTSGVQ